jgi:putative endonuclease
MIPGYQHNVWYVYLLVCRDGSLYCGVTMNLEGRLYEHNHSPSKGSKYVRSRLPAALLGWSRPLGKIEAMRHESRIKRLPRDQKYAALQAL